METVHVALDELICTRVDPVPNGSEHIRSRVKVALVPLDA